MSDKSPRTDSDAVSDALDTARETGKGNVRDAVSEEARELNPESRAGEGSSSAGRDTSSGSRNPGGGGDTGARAGNILGGIGLTGVIVLIVIAVVIYLLLR